MNVWTALVVIAVIWAFVAMYSKRHDRFQGTVRDEDGNPVFPPQQNRETDREVQELRERIKVLERIVTDERGPRNLANEIESLREKD